MFNNPLLTSIKSNRGDLVTYFGSIPIRTQIFWLINVFNDLCHFLLLFSESLALSLSIFFFPVAGDFKSSSLITSLCGVREESNNLISRQVAQESLAWEISNVLVGGKHMVIHSGINKPSGKGLLVNRA